MQDQRQTQTEASLDRGVKSRTKELTKEVINWYISIRQKKGGIDHHCKPSDLWGAAKAAQPEIASKIASDKAQMASRCTYRDTRSEGVTHC